MKYLIGAWLLGLASIAYANCTYHTYTTSDGRFVSCTTCCYGNNCNTTCF